jgi:hypothetical protein
VLVAAALVAACGGSDASRTEPIPTFPSSGSAPAAAPPRQTLLPTDCAEVLTGEAMTALLGQPLGVVQARTVLGLPAPAVGRIERVTCLYRRGADRTGRVLVTLNLSAYRNAEDSARQLSTDTAAERHAARSVQNLSIGTADAVLFDEPGQSVLLVADDRSGLALTLADGVVTPALTRQLLVDMAQRVLPDLVPPR